MDVYLAQFLTHRKALDEWFCESETIQGHERCWLRTTPGDGDIVENLLCSLIIHSSFRTPDDCLKRQKQWFQKALLRNSGWRVTLTGAGGGRGTEEGRNGSADTIPSSKWDAAVFLSVSVITYLSAVHTCVCIPLYTESCHGWSKSKNVT